MNDVYTLKNTTKYNGYFKIQLASSIFISLMKDYEWKKDRCSEVVPFSSLLVVSDQNFCIRYGLYVLSLKIPYIVPGKYSIKDFQSTEKMLSFDVILINFNKTLCSQLQHDNEYIFRKKSVLISEQINITIMLSRWPTHGHSLDFRVYLKHVVRDC